MTIALYARRKQWPLNDVTVFMRHSRVHAEDCADCETKTGMPDFIEREIALDGQLAEEERARLRDNGERRHVQRRRSSARARAVARRRRRGQRVARSPLWRVASGTGAGYRRRPAIDTANPLAVPEPSLR